ncbi:MAG: nucleotide exchange factor GrpE [Sneathiella sp.]
MGDSNSHKEPEIEEVNTEAETQEAVDNETMEALSEAEAADLNVEEAQAAEIVALKEKLLRAMAETQNIRSRSEKEKEDTHNFAVTKFARDMLSISDNLRRALDSVPADALEDETLKSLLEGVNMTEAELLSTLSRHKIEKIEAEGKKFDPNLHQAMFEIENLDVEPGTILQVHQAGFVIAGRLLRPSLVGIAKGGQKKTEIHIDQSA